MRKSLMGLMLLLIFMMVNHNAFAATAAMTNTVSPVGTWLTIDDETQKPRSFVKIWLDSNGQLEGQIIKIYFRPNEKPTDVCDKCTDPAHRNQRILGMIILWGMKQDNATDWSGGQILDPHNGQIYRCLISVSPDGKQLNVRGYVGISLFGRTQTWLRVSR